MIAINIDAMVDEMSSFLYKMDPMNIGTVENELTNEYRFEARFLINTGVNKDMGRIRETVETVFEFSFWKNCLKQEQIESITNEIARITGVRKAL